jgi:hypothetical protein
MLRSDGEAGASRSTQPITGGAQMRVVPAEGIEPPTFGLQNRCSTAELSRRGAHTSHGARKDNGQGLRPPGPGFRPAGGLA